MIGIDIVDIEKFNKKKNIFSLFTEEELAYARRKADPNQTLAGIFAAKEAVVKACSMKLYDILRKNIEIGHKEDIPQVFINNVPASVAISISHDGNYAIGICYNYSQVSFRINPYMQDLLPKREKNSHKGDYGRIAIIGGSYGMAGSVYMASSAAMRAGAGLTYIIAPQSIADILQIKSNEQIILPVSANNFIYKQEILDEVLELIKDKDVLAIGPGMGKGENLHRLIGGVIKNTEAKIVIDADGLNAISKDLGLLEVSNNIILTPHLMEFERLTGISIDEINENRLQIAKDFASKHNIILVLKSENTLVTDGKEVYVNELGNPGMATAGSGDVLTGIIATLLKRLSPYKAAVLGVYIHSLAGDIAKETMGEESMIATDIIDSIPEALKLLR